MDKTLWISGSQAVDHDPSGYLMTLSRGGPLKSSENIDIYTKVHNSSKITILK